MNDLFDDHIGDALHRAAAGVPGRGPGFGDVRRRVRHRRRVQTGLAAVPVVAAGGLLALRHSPVAVPLTPGALGTAGEGMPTTSPLSDCYGRRDDDRQLVRSGVDDHAGGLPCRRHSSGRRDGIDDRRRRQLGQQHTGRRPDDLVPR